MKVEVKSYEEKNPLTKVLFMDHDGVMVLRDKDGDLDD